MSENKIFKSLFDVQKTYFPEKGMEYFEGKDCDSTDDTFLKIFEKVKHPTQIQPANDNKLDTQE
jgi:hypothetical protein